MTTKMSEKTYFLFCFCLQDPLPLDHCVICCEQDWDDCFEIQEFVSKESYVFKVTKPSLQQQQSQQQQHQNEERIDTNFVKLYFCILTCLAELVCYPPLRHHDPFFHLTHELYI